MCDQCPHAVDGWEQVLAKRTAIFNAVIDFAIEDSEPASFLKTWREGDWETLRNEWPEFKQEIN